MAKSISAIELVKNVTHLNSLPVTLARLQELLDQPHSSSNDIAKVIGSDPGLTANLLKLVNSAYFGFNRSIESLEEAVRIVGTHQLHSLALANSASKLFDGLPSELISMPKFWRHSLFTALYGRLLGKQIQGTDPEHLFVCGLLHNMGSLILYSELPEESKMCFMQPSYHGMQRAPIEELMIGFSHADVAAELARLWHLPRRLEETIGNYIHPEQSRGFKKDASLIRLAATIAYAQDSEEATEEIPHQLWQDVELSGDLLNKLLKSAEQQFESAKRFILNRDDF
ncbi:MAG: hypothetical protein CMF25_00490 [Kangiellaceae bacterium]|jgi:HD-like signal output (HDOD) protein|nr:hypothetical protein [Kangiellaceae bacterium]|tara:strand:+ start:27117 stop:27968 length:852 start_codon:yes stop_codon:yes gene_type:complete